MYILSWISTVSRLLLCIECAFDSTITNKLSQVIFFELIETLRKYLGVAKDNHHHDDVIMRSMASQITSLTIIYSTVYSGTDQRKHQSSASLAFVQGIHRGPVNSPHKWPVTRKMFPFDDVIMHREDHDLIRTSWYGNVCRVTGLCEGNHQSLGDSPHKGPLLRGLTFSVLSALPNC